MAERQIINPLKVLILVILLLLSCKEPEPYKLGFLGALTGHSSALGLDGRNGFILAIEECNKAGGINGRGVEALVRDGKTDPDLAGYHMETFQDKNAEAVIGPFTSSQVAAVLSAANRSGLLLLSPTASAQALVGLDDMLFRTNFSTRESCLYYADYMIRMGLKDVGIVYDLENATFSVSWKDEFARSYESLGGKVLITEGIDSRVNTDFSTILDRVLHSGSDSLLLVANSIDSSNLIQHLRMRNQNLPVIASDWSSSFQLIELGGKSADGTIILQPYDPFDESPEFQSFEKLFRNRFKTSPSSAAVLTYDSTNIIIQGLREKREDESLKEALLRLSPFQGLQDEISFDQYGDAFRFSVLSVIENGSFRKVE